MSEYYISLDIEADGPCPGLNSMLQFGAVFYDAEGNEVDSICENLELLEGATTDPDTMAWWAEQEKKRPGTYTSTRTNLVTPSAAMKHFECKVKYWETKLESSAVVIGFPITFDFSFLYYYLHRFTGRSCVGFSALDLKTLGMAVNYILFKMATKRNFPRHWFNKKMHHTHNALDDARGQGYMFFQIMKDLKKKF